MKSTPGCGVGLGGGRGGGTGGGTSTDASTTGFSTTFRGGGRGGGGINSVTGCASDETGMGTPGSGWAGVDTGWFSAAVKLESNEDSTSGSLTISGTSTDETRGNVRE